MSFVDLKGFRKLAFYCQAPNNTNMESAFEVEIQTKFATNVLLHTLSYDLLLSSNFRESSQNANCNAVTHRH